MHGKLREKMPLKCIDQHVLGMRKEGGVCIPAFFECFPPLLAKEELLTSLC
jgi:hypothetical protein